MDPENVAVLAELAVSSKAKHSCTVVLVLLIVMRKKTVNVSPKSFHISFN